MLFRYDSAATTDFFAQIDSKADCVIVVNWYSAVERHLSLCLTKISNHLNNLCLMPVTAVIMYVILQLMFLAHSLHK